LADLEKIFINVAGVDHEEIEANQFGAALLMPRSLV
jgi:hypothetical protein